MRGEDRRWCLCVAADEGFRLPLLLTLRSTARTNRYPLELIVLSDGLAAATQSEVRRIADRAGWTVDIVEVHDQVANTAVEGVAPASLARLRIVDTVPTRFARAVYLDVDVQVHGDLRPLASLDLGGELLGAVTDPGALVVAHLETFASHGIDLGGRYFNSGVLLWDLDGLRSGGWATDLEATIAEVSPWAEFSDQDYLNAHFAHRWHEIPPEWNVQSRHFYPRTSRFRLRRPSPIDLRSTWQKRRVVHFNSPRRPWTRGTDHPGRPGYLARWAASPYRSLPGPTGEPLCRLVFDRATVRSAIDAAVARFRSGR